MLVSDRDRYAALLRRSPLPGSVTTTTTTTALGQTGVTVQPGLPDPTSGIGKTDRQRATEKRELVAHAQLRNCVPTADGIVAAELKEAQQLDPRVGSADMERAVDRARRAKELVPVRQQVLNGFTRVVDAKMTLTPALVSALCADVGKDAADLLLAAIDNGPGPHDGKGGAIAFPHPQGKVELVASLVRQLLLGKGASLQLPIDAAQAAWLEQVAAREGSPIKLAMGGAGAFAANLMSALDNVRPRFFSGEPLPEKIGERFAARVEVVDHTGTSTTPSKHQDASPARMNFACEYNGGEALSVLGRTSLKVNGTSTPLSVSGSGRVILGTKGKDVTPGFAGVDDAALQKMGRDHDLFFFVGSHYLTAHHPTEALQLATELGRSLDVMKAANPKLVRHLQYVVPKVAAQEAAVLGALKGHVESLSMNAVEVPMLVDRLHGAGLSGVDLDPNMTRDLAEEPASMVEGARAIKHGLGLQRVHLHGLLGDLVVVDASFNDGVKGGGITLAGGGDVERTRLALLRARQLASMKAANDSGELKSVDDLFDVIPVVEGKCLAALQRFADAMVTAHGLDDDARAAIVRDWCWVDAKGGEAVFFIPSRGIHDRTGGTVSLGDTIDASALVFGRSDARPKEHPQLVR